MKSRMIHTVILLALFGVGALISVGNSPVFAGKRPGQDRVPAIVQLLDNESPESPKYMIRSDDGSAYEDGMRGVKAAFNPATNDLILTMPSDLSRWITFDFTEPFGTDPSYGVSAGLNIVVAGIYGMKDGDTDWAVANMNAGIVYDQDGNGAAGTVRFGYLSTEIPNDSVPVCVQRTGDIWNVSTTSVTCGEVGDKARLTRLSGNGKNQQKTISYHHMPFSLIATLKAQQ